MSSRLPATLLIVLWTATPALAASLRAPMEWQVRTAGIGLSLPAWIEVEPEARRPFDMQLPGDGGTSVIGFTEPATDLGVASVLGLLLAEHSGTLPQSPAGGATPIASSNSASKGFPLSTLSEPFDLDMDAPTLLAGVHIGESGGSSTFDPLATPTPGGAGAPLLVMSAVAARFRLRRR